MWKTILSGSEAYIAAAVTDRVAAMVMTAGHSGSLDRKRQCNTAPAGCASGNVYRSYDTQPPRYPTNNYAEGTLLLDLYDAKARR
ncbi:MAG: hypothetical protein V7629_00895 [Motiliproteus sp.]